MTLFARVITALKDTHGRVGRGSDLLDYGYLGLLTLSCVASGWIGLLRGRGPRSTSFLKAVRAALFLTFWYPVYKMCGQGALLWWLYFPSYLDLSELSGARISAWFRRSFIAKRANNYFDCSLVKTCEISAPQCILAMHPHGLLPLAGVINVNSDTSRFEEVFPTLKKRVIAAASIVSLAPIFRDVVLAVGVVDCSRYSFESFLRRGYTVGVFVGGAFEALRSYAHADEEILDLKRKKGFLRLSMIHRVPVVPCYTFNEVDHIYQIREEFINKFWLLSMIRRVYNRVTGVIVPIIVPFFMRGSKCVTVVGAPMEFRMCGGQAEPSEGELQEAMERYCEALQQLYSDHAHKYNRRKDRRLVIN